MYTSATIKMIANVGGTVCDIVSFTSKFAMNAIPTAVVTLAPGREALSLQISTAHTITRDTLQQIPTTIYMQVSYVSNPPDILPAGTYTMFEGWTTGVGYRRTHAGVHITLEVTHWLTALTFASILSQSSCPSNPSDFSCDAAMEFNGANGGSLTADTLAFHWFGDPARISADMWGNCMLPWLRALASSDRLNVAQFGTDGTGNDSRNGDCAKALARFRGDALPFDWEVVDGAEVHFAAAMAADVAMTTLTPLDNNADGMSMAHTTMWAKLVELSAIYRFAIIPFPTKAMVVPLVPGLRSTWPGTGGTGDFTIIARDIAAYDMDMLMIRPLRAVGIYAGYGARAGGLQPVDRPPLLVSDNIGGWYIARGDGMVMIQEAPRFIGQVMQPSIYARQALAIDRGAVRATAFHPGAGMGPQGPAPRKVRESQRTMLDRVAHAVYATEMLRQRVGHLTGPVRCDICPGSTIKIEGTAGAFTADYDPQGSPHYATVYQVVYNIDAQSARATTTFDLAYIRSEAENASDATSIERHPLYKRTWTGDMMLGG